MWKYQFIEISRGEFEPQALKKNQTSISQEIEEKILSMCANGMTTDDITVHIQDIFPAIQSDSNSNVALHYIRTPKIKKLLIWKTLIK